MFRQAYFFLVFVILSSTLSALPTRIVGGFNASLGEFPHQVSLREWQSQQHMCGGSIISDNFILTAAHCTMDRSPSEIFAVVGTVLLNSGGTKYELSEIIIHPEFDIDRLHSDLSLVKTSESIVYSSEISTI